MTAAQIDVAPRLIRLGKAPAYLGMDRNRFNREVRPQLTEIPIGVQGVAFDRLDLDAWADDYKRRNGRPGRQTGDSTWDERKPLDSTFEMESGTSTKSSEVCAFARALDKVSSKRRKSTSRGGWKRRGKP
jgi:hypothetical protein